MWFPTNTQEKIAAKMALIEEYFIKYYGEKHRDKINKKFKEFFFIVVHGSLYYEKLFFSDNKNKIITKHTKTFLNRLGINENFEDYVLVRIYENLIDNDIDSLIANIEKTTKKNIRKIPFLLNYKVHIKDYRKMLLDIENDLSKVICHDDFIKIKKVIKKFQYEYLKEISDVLSDNHKQLLSNSSNDIDYVLDKLKYYLPEIDFENSTIEFWYQKYSIDYLNDILLPEDAKRITDENINKIKNSRIKIKNALIEYLHNVYEEYLKSSLVSKGIDEEVELNEDVDSTCYIGERVQDGKKSIYSIIKFVLPVNDCTIIHELNHHIETYINEKGQGISGWQPTKEKYIDKNNYSSWLLTEVVNDLISEDIVKLMHDNGIYIIGNESRSASDYQTIRPLIEKIFIKFKDIIIESRIGENPSILFEEFGEQNLKDLNELFKEVESHKDFPFNVNSDFLQYYQSISDDILQRMIEYKKSKSIK